MTDMYQLNQIPSDAQIRKYLRRIIFGKNVFCPNCRSRNVLRYENRYRCKRCRCKFSLLSHTWLANIKIPLEKFWLILWCWTTQVPVKQSMALTKLSEKAVRHWFDNFRDNLPDNPEILSKLVQLDEAFFKKRTLILAKQPGTRKLAYEVLNTTNVQRHHAAYFLQQHVKPRSKLYTDGAGIYQSIDSWWPVKHKSEIHSKWEFSLTSEIEGTFGNFRTFVRRMYHHVTPDKLPDLVREFCFRFSSPEIFQNPLKYLEKTLILVPTG
jgi:transposase-like protein